MPPNLDQIYNRIATLLLCYIQYPYLEKGEQIVNVGWIIEKSFIDVPVDFNAFEYPVAVEFTKHKIVNALFQAFIPYFDGKGEGEYIFQAVLDFNGMKQQIDITIRFEELRYFIVDIFDHINQDHKFDFEFPHEIERPIFLDPK